MRTVDVLTAARNLLANRDNWTQGSLWREKFTDSGKRDCFCALGAVLKEGGCLTERKTTYARTFIVPTAVPESAVCGGGGCYNQEDAHRRVRELGHTFLAELEAKGIHLKATDNAIQYLGAAVGQEAEKIGLTGVNYIWSANDNLGYEFVMRAFDRAIKNAKRRHINGDHGWKPRAPKAAKATQQVIIQEVY